MKKNNGFTLSELLIVVAIIAVLTAIAIPVFVGQLERSKEATDMANGRSAYAAAVTAYLNGNTKDGKATASFTYTQGVSGWGYETGEISYDIKMNDATVSETVQLPDGTKDTEVTITVSEDEDGNVTVKAE